MGKFWDKFDPIDFIAFTIIIGCIVSMAVRGDSVFKEVLNTVVGFYFGRQTKNSPGNNSGTKTNGLIILFILQHSFLNY